MRCPTLPDIQNGVKFYVSGKEKTEVMNTGIDCSVVSPGNSCHYECEQGYRLTGSPVMVCNNSGMWEGSVPSCQGYQMCSFVVNRIYIDVSQCEWDFI